MERKNQYITKILIVLLVIAFTGCAPDLNQRVVNLTNLIKADEFDVDGKPDPALWGFNYGTGENGWGNNELQFYTDRPENVIVEDGVLKIIARKEEFRGASYTSARLLTKGKFETTYGRFEARMQMPWGRGLWPAFWLLGADDEINIWPACGEIDVMEYRGQEPTLVAGSVHGPGYSGSQAITKSYDLVNDRLDTGFHIFGIEWGPDYINFYVDDVLYSQITPEDLTGEWVFNKPFYIIINVAVGGSYVGPPNSETVFPQTLLVDYVRIYN
jgi:beta-glucanase (GH16 family)